MALFTSQARLRPRIPHRALPGDLPHRRSPNPRACPHRRALPGDRPHRHAPGRRFVCAPRGRPLDAPQRWRDRWRGRRRGGAPWRCTGGGAQGAQQRVARAPGVGRQRDLHQGAPFPTRPKSMRTVTGRQGIALPCWQTRHLGLFRCCRRVRPVSGAGGPRLAGLEAVLRLRRGVQLPGDCGGRRSARRGRDRLAHRRAHAAEPREAPAAGVPRGRRPGCHRQERELRRLTAAMRQAL